MQADFMLDTNILSQVLKRANGSAAVMLKRVGFARVCTSAVVASEMRYGAKRKGSLRLVEEIEVILGRVSILAYDNAASHVYAQIRTDLERAGTPIGTNDLFIAAHAKALDLTLVTDNVREFSRVEGLKLENWIERQADV